MVQFDRKVPVGRGACAGVPRAAFKICSWDATTEWVPDGRDSSTATNVFAWALPDAVCSHVILLPPKRGELALHQLDDVIRRIAKFVAPHVLRHSFGTSLLGAGSGCYCQLTFTGSQLAVDTTLLLTL